MEELERLCKENAELREENRKYMQKFIELLCTESPEQATGICGKQYRQNFWSCDNQKKESLNHWQIICPTVSSSIARLNSQMSRLGRINNTNNTDGGNPLGNLRINSLRVTSASTRVSGGNVTVHGFNPSSNGNTSRCNRHFQRFF